jgi:DNA polymerase-3 subunit gamma/tau
MVTNTTGDGGAGGGGATPYVVLARKYRPENFEDMIGQDALVRTLRNAFATDRIAQGYMLTGVRGVGKTTTARILARALNYEKPGVAGKPTVDFDGYGTHCLDIVRGRHPDIIEMDAASNTGVDDVREIIENARYRPILARYKVFIIDEVHMLSKSAFNALLKTLEEPPEHVKFIFATTEVRKVPVTVLSRCQRFDLRRVDVPVLAAHFARIVDKEGATAEPEALTLIARAAEGSVRDGLSLLDQAIAMGSGTVRPADVRAMLGLADRGRIFDLLEKILAGKTAEALAAIEALHAAGADPAQVISDLAEAVHIVTRAKVAGVDHAGEGLAREERQRAGALAGQLTMPLLARAWQMLLKGAEETNRAPNARAASEMVVIRLAHVADLPTPDDAIRLLGGERPVPRDARRTEAPPAPRGEAPRGPLNESENPAPADFVEPDDADSELADPVDEPTAVAPRFPMPRSFAEVLSLVGARRDARLKLLLEDQVSLVRFEPGRLEIFALPGAPSNLANELADKLGRWTGQRWIVALSREPGERPVGEVRREEEARELAELREHPAVRAVLAAFPGADIAAVRPLSSPDEADADTDDDSAAG